ncbi:hypothetical protein Bbelb_402770 [Branchiostoma belcheri]|nr:hypothetical protein Bbelb_402770 [Branchiostoma belcheri]
MLMRRREERVYRKNTQKKSGVDGVAHTVGDDSGPFMETQGMQPLGGKSAEIVGETLQTSGLQEYKLASQELGDKSDGLKEVQISVTVNRETKSITLARGGEATIVHIEGQMTTQNIVKQLEQHGEASDIATVLGRYVTEALVADIEKVEITFEMKLQIPDVPPHSLTLHVPVEEERVDMHVDTDSQTVVITETEDSSQKVLHTEGELTPHDVQTEGKGQQLAAGDENLEIVGESEDAESVGSDRQPLLSDRSISVTDSMTDDQLVEEGRSETASPMEGVQEASPDIPGIVISQDVSKKDVSEEQETVKPKKKVKIKEGKSIRIEAECGGSPEPEMCWFKSGRLVETQKRVSISQEEGKSVLEIHKVSLDDDAIWVCKAINTAGQAVFKVDLENFKQQMEKQASRLPSKLPRAPKLIKQAAVTEELAKISEESSGVDSSYEYTMTPTLETIQESPKLAPKLNRPAMPPRQPSIKPPVFIQDIDSCLVSEGSKVNFNGEVMGNPQPDITWLFNDEKLPESKRHKAIYYDEVVRLTILHVTQKDQGIYTCKAVNFSEIPPPEPLEPIEEVITSDLVDGEASEPEEPEGIPPYFTQKPTSQKVEEGQDVKFVCKLVAAPSPEVTWYHGNKTVKVTGRFSVEIEADVHHYVVTFTIRQTNPKDAGSYIITLSNSVGEAKAMVSLTVERPKKEEAPDFRAKLKTKKVEEKPPEPEIPQEVPAAFVKVPKNLTVYAGISGKFECKYIGEPQPNLAWFRNDAALPQDERCRVEITDSGMCTLHIDAITMADAGWYKCVVSNQHGEQSCCAKLMVEDKPEVVEEPPAVEEEQKDIPTIQEEPVTVEKDTSIVEELRQAAFEVHEETVDARDESKAELRVEEKAAPTETLTELTVGEGLDLKRAKSPLVEFPLDKERTFSGASVESPAPEDFLSAEEGPEEDETVPSAPSFLQTIEDFIVVPGEPALFQCRVAGNPTPEVAWFRDGAKIEPSDRYVIERSDAGVTSLTIRDVTEKDEAEYTCTAVNSAGSAFCTADIYFSEESRGEKLKTKLEQKRITKQEMIVEFPPESPTEGKDETAAEPEFAPPKFVGEIIDEIVRVEVGGTARFTRRAVGRPKPQLIWYKDDAEIEPGGRFTIEYSNDGSSSLVIPNVRPEDEEEYICRAVSEAGQAMCYADLIVDRAEEEAPQIIPPSFSREYGEIRAMEGGSVRFVAAVTGSPEIEVAWLKDGVELHEGPKHWILFDDNVAVLAIPRVDLADEGFYTCRARNAAGMVEISAPLIIEVPELKFEAPPPKVVKPKIKKPVAKKEEKVEEKPVLVKPKVKKPKPKKEVPMVGEEAVKKAKPKTKGPGPFFIMKPKYRTVPEGSGTQFRAKVGGDPKPTVRWMKGKWRSIEDSARIHVYHDTKKDEYVMEIRETKPSDAGNYKCIIENEGGKEVCGVTLIVEEKPKELLDWRSLLKPVSLRKEEEHDIDIWEILKNVDPSEYEKYARMFKIYDFRGLLHHLIWQRAQLEEGRKKLEAAKKGREAWQPRTPTPQPMEGAEVDFERAFEEMQKSLYAEERVMPLRGPEDQRIPPHNRARFECEIEIRDPKIELEWYLKGEKCVEGEKFQFERKNNTYTLIVNDGRIEDSGKVGVVAGPYKGSAFLTVDPMLKAGFLSGIGDIEVPQGEPGTFCCEVTPDDADVTWYKEGVQLEQVTPDDADVTWYKEGVQLEQDEKFQFVKHGNKRMLVVRDCQPSDEAIYAVTCGDEKSEGGLTVEGPVEFVVELEDVHVMEHQTATFCCELTRDDVEVHWYKNGQRIEAGLRYQIRQERRVASLVLVDVQTEEQGTQFTAQAGPDGPVSTATLFVEMEVMEITKHIENIEVIERHNATFECELNTEYADVTWFRDEKQLEPGEKYSTSQKGCSYYLTIYDVTADDEGEYTAVVADKSCRAELFVILEGALQLVRPLEDVHCLEWQPNVYFECEISAAGQQPRWFRLEEEIFEGDKYRFEVDGKVQRLHFHDVVCADQDEYSFKIERISTTAKLYVEAREIHFDSPISDLERLAGEPAHFEFELDQTDVETRWFKEETQITMSPKYKMIDEQTKHKLEILDCQPDDAALYKVKAGPHTSEAHLWVKTFQEKVAMKGGDATLDVLFPHEADDDVRWFMLHPVDEETISAIDEIGVEAIPGATLAKEMPRDVESPVDVAAAPPLPDDAIVTPEGAIIIPDKGLRMSPIAESDKYTFLKEGRRQSLIIHDADDDDKQAYTAKSQGVEVVTDLKLTERTQLLVGPENQEVPFHTKCVFECEINNETEDVLWLKYEQELPKIPKYSYEKDGFKRRLIIKDCVEDDEDDYQVVAGEDKAEAWLLVIGSPEVFLRPLQDQEILESEEAVFECEISLAKREVTWYREDQQIFPGDKYEMVTEHKVRRLKVKDGRLADEGEYSCIFGDQKTTANLYVKAVVLEPEAAEEILEVVAHCCCMLDPTDPSGKVVDGSRKMATQ